MKLSELLDVLNEVAQEAGDIDPEVTIHLQPNWPLESRLGNVKLVLDGNGAMVWLAEGSHVGYGDRRAWDAGTLDLAVDEGEG